MILDQHISNDVLRANCLVTVKPNNRVNISILNTSERPIEIKSNLCLKIEPFINKYNFNSVNNNSLSRTQEVIDNLRISHLNQEESDDLLNLCSNFSDIFHLPLDTMFLWENCSSL